MAKKEGNEFKMEQSVFTEKNLKKALLVLALPAMLGQLTTLIYNLAETYFVSLTNDPNQIAAITLSAPVMLIIMSVSSIFGVGGSSMIARLIGEKKEEKAREVANFCLFTMLGVSIVVAVVGTLLMPDIVKLLGGDANNIGYTSTYLKYIFYGSPFIIISIGMVHILRSAGLVRQSTQGLMIGNVANVVFCFLFIVVFKMGIAGAGLAALLGFLLNALYNFGCIFQLTRQKHPVFSIVIKEYAPTWKMTGAVFSIGIPGALVTVLMSLVNIVLNNYIGKYGSDAVASYGIAFRIDMIAIMLSVGMSQGVLPLIGYCYGAKEKVRLKQVMKLSVLYGVVMGTFFAALFLATNRFLVGLFFEQDALIALSGDFLKILSCSIPVLGITNMVTSYYQATGKSFQSLLITCFRNVVLFIPIIMLLNQFFGLNGVVAAQPVVETIMALFCSFMLYVDLKKYLVAKPNRVIKNEYECV